MATAKEKAFAGSNFDFLELMQKASREAEKKSKLEPVFLGRTSFASRACPTRSLCLDTILGGGIPPGRMVSIAGPEHSGKSLLTTDIAREHLERGGVVVLMDAEGGTDPMFLRARGIDFAKYRGQRTESGNLKKGEFDRIFFYQPTTGEEFRDYLINFMDKMPDNRDAEYPPVLFILDSVVALIPRNLLEDPDGNNMAMHARMYSQEILPFVNARLVRTGCSLIYTNQLRQKPGVSYGSPDYEPCGNALRFYASIRMELKTTKPKMFNGEKEHPFVTGSSPCIIDSVKPRAQGVWEEPHYANDGEKVGLDRYRYTGISTPKNKVFNPQKICWVRIQFESNGSTGYGMDPVFDTFTFLNENGFLIKAIPNKEKNEKADDVRGKYEIAQKELFDLSTLGFPERFDYLEYKRFIESKRETIVSDLRKHLIESGVVFSLTSD